MVTGYKGHTHLTTNKSLWFLNRTWFTYLFSFIERILRKWIYKINSLTLSSPSFTGPFDPQLCVEGLLGQHQLRLRGTCRDGGEERKWSE